MVYEGDITLKNLENPYDIRIYKLYIDVKPKDIKATLEFFCPINELIEQRIPIENKSDTDIFNHIEHSFNYDFRNLNMDDLMKIIALMPNQRYRKLIEYRYVHELSNEETATLMSMTMANYYNKHKLAKAQFVAALRKEGLV